MRTPPALAAALLAVPLLAACGGSEKKEPPGHPFAGTWRSGGTASAGSGGTTLTVAADGAVRFKSSLDCKGTAAPSGGGYRFSIDCGTSKFTGTAPPPRSGTFTMTWTDGDTTEYHAT
ncbi:hypothetical protein AGRA3207_006830 [Actinomadura graeca]|uniref:Lipoprotein n=1 Tax=Actinomadura graeca TaxID=2750812 RepID=A0ABX8R455_9ACTN|nr:hypothetical protein [Actinomadura graeca]QXJ25346.1 hypothetical protein AGRA3207_006830 [Actinomadura graeca]